MSTRFHIALVCMAAALFADASAAVPTQVGLAMPGASAAGAQLSREQFISSVARDVASHFSLQGNLEIELLRGWTPPAQPAGSWTVSVIEYPNVASSSMMLRCRIVADSKVVAEPTLVVRAALWRDAWATRAPLTVGATFDPAELETRKVDLFRERDALPAAVGDRSYIFARGVAAGHLLTWRDVARKPLVKKGNMVDVTAVDGLLVITMRGLAMENGAQGDTVTIRNPESRKDFTALVVDENRVQVRF